MRSELVAAAGSQTADTSPVAPRLDAGRLIGRTLGGFRITELLASGGSADVFRADDLALGRCATIKVLRARGTGYQIERFMREVRLAAALDHPYVAHVYGFGAEADELIWIAMEYVRGVTVEAMVDARGRMPAPMFVPWFARVCEVVHFAHQCGVVHRDIKGSNVMVIERAGQLLPKLLDFGVAKLARERDAPSRPADAGPVDVTRDDAMIGTPLFMSPEQWESDRVDRRADIYALGVLAYFCLSARYPFEHHDRATLREAHLCERPPRLRDVPVELATAVECALAKSRADRWPDALSFAAAMTRSLDVPRRRRYRIGIWRCSDT
jgi:serine/threonine protein kinase